MSTDLRVSVAEYDQMIERGDFNPVEEHHVELIRGEIRQMSPIHPPHEESLDRFMYWSMDQTPRAEVRVRIQLSVGLPELESVPQPDIAWVRRRDYSKQRPTADDVLLLVEISDSTIRFDRGEKADLYAEAGIADYWIVDVKRHAVEVCREPRSGTYQQRAVVPSGEAVSPLAFPQLSLAVAELFPGDA